MSMEKKTFGKMPTGETVCAYTLARGGIRAAILNMGGILQSLSVPDRSGKTEDIVCGFDTVEGYLTGGGYHGALIGRYANRIRDGRFCLNGREIQLNRNENGICTLHGGNVGFNQKLWDVRAVCGNDADSLELSLFSPDGDEHFPGNLSVRVTYTLRADGTLTLHYEADTDRDTVVNLTNHSYFNLLGYANGDVAGHIIQIQSDHIAAVDENLLPTGVAAPVDGTVFDLRTPAPMTAEYDHSFFLDRRSDPESPAVTVREPVTGRCMEVRTDMPAVQFYTGNFLGGDVPFKGGVSQEKHHGFCLETQFSPDSPNQPAWPSPVLRAGEHYDHVTSFRFYAE